MRLRGKDLPIIPIGIKGENGWIIYNAFIDSGAGYSVFQSDITEDLDLNLKDGVKKYMTVGDGSLIIVYIHQLNIRIGNIKFEAGIGFSKQLGIGFNIIGRKDIFEKFKVCFDDKERILEFFTGSSHK